MALLQSVLLGEALSKGGPMRMTKTLTRLGLVLLMSAAMPTGGLTARIAGAAAAVNRGGVVTIFGHTGIDDPTDIVAAPNDALSFVDEAMNPNDSIGQITTSGQSKIL